MTFKDNVVKIGRVRLVGFPDSLPPSLVRRIRERSEFLANRIDNLDAEIGFTYPPIEITPRCIVGPWEGHVVFARKSFRTFNETGYIIVQISAPSILAFSADRIDAILAHEFLHYVWDTINFLSYATEINGVLVSNVIDEHPDYMKSEESHDVLDSERQAVDVNWLPMRLVELHRRLSGPNKNLFIKPSMLEVFEKWLRRAYPTEKIDPDYRYRGPLNLDDALVARARKLGLLKSP